MEKLSNELWRLWVSVEQKVVSFHEVQDYRMMEFRSHEMFLNCVDEFTMRCYRYQ